MASMTLLEWMKAQRGRCVALARHLGVEPSMVNRMAHGRKQVPLDHCPYIEQFTQGEVRCEELRPDRPDYFALIRQLAGGAAVVVQATETPPNVAGAIQSITAQAFLGDRRAPGLGRDAGTDIDRRTAVGG